MKYRVLILATLASMTVSVAHAQSFRYARVISENANLREAPTIKSATNETIPEGTLIKILDEKLPWYVVRWRDRVGWIHGNAIEFLSISNPSPGRTSLPDTESLSPRINTRRTASSRSVDAGRQYIRGPRGGCYYLSGSGRKVYVDHSLCN